MSIFMLLVENHTTDYNNRAAVEESLDADEGYFLTREAAQSRADHLNRHSRERYAKEFEEAQARYASEVATYQRLLVKNELLAAHDFPLEPVGRMPVEPKQLAYGEWLVRREGTDYVVQEIIPA